MIKPDETLGEALDRLGFDRTVFADGVELDQRVLGEHLGDNIIENQVRLAIVMGAADETIFRALRAVLCTLAWKAKLTPQTFSLAMAESANAYRAMYAQCTEGTPRGSTLQ